MFPSPEYHARQIRTNKHVRKDSYELDDFGEHDANDTSPARSNLAHYIRNNNQMRRKCNILDYTEEHDFKDTSLPRKYHERPRPTKSTEHSVKQKPTW